MIFVLVDLDVMVYVFVGSYLFFLVFYVDWVCEFGKFGWKDIIFDFVGGCLIYKVWIGVMFL